MKKSALLLLAISPVLAIAGIIVPKSGDNIEDATNIVVSDTEISYQIGSENKTINRSDVSAIMYDDGRYEEIKSVSQQQTTSMQAVTDFKTSASMFSSYRDEWKGDWKAFCRAYPTEVQEVTKAIQTIFKKQGIFNFKGAGEIDAIAMNAYMDAKASGADGITAVRARNEAYINKASELVYSALTKEKQIKDEQLTTTTDSSPKATATSNRSQAVNMFNVLAYGEIEKGLYTLNHNYDGADVEWRTTIKNGKQTIQGSFQYLGKTPLALVSEDFKNNYSANFIKFNISLPEEVSYMQATPFVVPGLDESNKKNVTVEFKITKGNKSFIYELQNTKLQTGEGVYIPLNKLR